MHFATHKPAGGLGRWIVEVIHFRGFEPDHSVERLVPTGHPSIILALDGMARHTYDNRSLEVQSTLHGGWVYGMHKHYLSISAHPHSEMLVLRFQTPGAFAFLHEPMAHFAERIIPLPDALGGALQRLFDNVVAASDSAAKFAAVDAWLHERYRPELDPPAALVTLISALRADPSIPFATLATSYPHSHKTLIDHFKRHVGMTPKYFQRLLRCIAVFEELSEGRTLAWADLAQATGYTDQAHFIREFRHFSGFTPEAFRTADYEPDATNYFPLDRDE